MKTRPLLALAVAGALTLAAPGFPAYQAAAAEVAAPVPAAWNSAAVAALAMQAQLEPEAGKPSVGDENLRVLQQAHLELTLDGANREAAAFARYLGPEHGASPEAFRKLSPELRVAVIHGAVALAKRDLTAEARAILKKRDSGAALSAADQAAVRRLSQAWMYLPAEDAARIKSLASESRSSRVVKAASAIASRFGVKMGDRSTMLARVSVEDVLEGVDRLGREYNGDVQGTLAPYAARAMEQASRRLAERGLPDWKPSSEVLTQHRVVFGVLAPSGLVERMRKQGSWTEFVSAFTLESARRLSKSGSDEARAALQKGGQTYDLRLAIPSWSPLARGFSSVADWLSATFGRAPPDPMGRGLKFKLFGMPILITPGCFAAILYMGLQDKTMAGGFVPALVFGASLYGSVLAHEFGHAWASRWFGIRTHKIALNILGGGAYIDHEARKAWPDFAIAAAGPLVTFLVGLAPLIPARLLHLHVGLPTFAFVGLNLLIGVFNLIPVYPMDGGRMLDAALTKVLGDGYRASRISYWVTRILSAAMFAAGFAATLITGRFMWAFGGLFMGVMGVVAQHSMAHPGTTLVPDRPAEPGKPL